MKKINRFLYFFKKSFVSQKGMALLATLIFVFVLATLGIALLTMTRNEIKLSVLQEESTKAFYLADAGIEKALNWLETFSTPPTQEDINATNFNGEYEYSELNTGKYTVKLSIDAGLGGLVARYIIETEGVVTRPDNSRVSRKIENLVKVSNFAEYAYFSDDERFPNNSNISGSTGPGGYAGSTIWFTGNDTLGGKVHSNSQFHMVDVPTFLGKLTSTANNIDFWDNAYAEDGIDFPGFTPMGNYELGVDTISLPQYRNISDLDDEYSLQRIAGGSWEKSYIENLSDGVNVPSESGGVSGGIYIQGDANIELNVDSSAGTAGPNSEITISQLGNTTIITSVKQPITLPAGSYLNGILKPAGTDIPADTTLIKRPNGHYESYQGITNGLLFVDGSINELSGGNHKGKMTVVSTESINITGDLLYESRNSGTQAGLDVNELDMSLIEDSLGLVAAKDVKIVSGPSDPWDIEIDAIIMALNTSFFYDDWRDRLKGTLNLLGGLIQKERGPVGTHREGTKITGYSKNYNYDTRMANPTAGYLPPYFPTTGQYEKVYWKEVY